MNKSNQSFFKKLFSIYFAFSLTFSHLSPFFLFASQVHAAQIDVTPESLQQPDTIQYNPESHSLELSFSQVNTPISYALYYEHDEKVDAAVGQTSTGTASIFVGTKSNDIPTKAFPNRAILKLQTVDSDVVFATQLELEYSDTTESVSVPFVSYENSDVSLTTSESMWLTNGVHQIDRVDTNVTYEYPLNSSVSVTFTSLPEEGGSLRIKELQLNDEQVQELGAASSIAYEITSSMENSTFEYDLTLPNPVQEGDAVIQYSEDGETFEEVTGDDLSTEQKNGNSVVKITGLDHFTVFVVTNPNPTYSGGVNNLRQYLTVTPETDPLDWAFYTFEGSYVPAPVQLGKVEFVTGPTTPIIGTGSIKLSSGDAGSKAILLSKSLDSLKMSAISELSFNTYTLSNPKNRGVYVNVYIDTNNDGIKDQQLNIDYSSQTVFNTWQSWDLTDHSAWQTLVTNFPDATIVSPWPDGGGIAFNAGDTANGYPYLSVHIDGLEVTFQDDETTVEKTFSFEPLKSISPIFECAVPVGNNNFKLLFGYENKNESQVTIPVGDSNKVTGVSADSNQGQPTIFEYPVVNHPDGRPGRTPFQGQGDPAFTVVVPTGQNVVWNLLGKTATGNSNKLCDNVAPEVEITNPLVNTFVRGTITGNALATDDWGMGSYYLRFWKNAFESGVANLVKNCQVAPGADLLGNSLDVDCVFDTTQVSDGPYVFSAQFLDSFTKWGAAQSSFTVDNTPPTITVKETSVGNGGNIFKIVSFKLYDAYKIDKVEINGVLKELSNNKYSDVNNVKTGVFGAVEGANTIVVYDVAGNTTTYDFVIDTTTPAIPNLISPEDGAVVNGASVTQVWSESDEDVVAYKYESYNDEEETSPRWNDTFTTTSKTALNVAETSYWWKVKAVDHVGNESEWSELWKISVDNTNPIISYVSPISGDYYSGDVNISVEVDEPNPHQYQFRIRGMVDGNPTGQFYSTGWVTVDETFDGTFNHIWDSTTAPYGDGQYRLDFDFKDKAGNSAKKNLIFNVDNGKPSIPQDLTVIPVSPTNQTTQTWSWSPSTDIGGSGILGYWTSIYDVVNGTFYQSDTFVGNVNSIGTSLTEGIWKFFVNAEDVVGNVSDLAESEEYVVDTTIPSSQIYGPAPSTESEVIPVYLSTWNGGITGAASDLNGSGIAGVEILVQRSIDDLFWTTDGWQAEYTQDNRVIASISSVSPSGEVIWNYFIPQEEIVDSMYSITSKAFDLAGNKENSAKILIVLDQIIPEVSISVDPINPDGANGWYKTRPTITLTQGASFSGIKTIQYSWNNASGPWTTYTGPFQIPAQGSYVLYYQAINNADVPSETGVKKIRWDESTLTQGPLNVSANPSRTSGSTSTISWESAVDNIGIDRYEIIWKLKNGGPEYSKNVSGATRETEIDRMTQEGEWEVFVRAYDPVGNMKEGVTLVRVVQTAPAAPTLALTGTAIGAANLSWNAVENASRYIVYYGVNPGEYIFAASVGNTTAYTVQGLAEDTYYFMVRAVDDVDNQSSNSNEVTSGAITGAAGTVPGTGGTTPADGFDEAGDVLGDEDDLETANSDDTELEGQVAGVTDENCNTFDQNLPWILFALLSVGAIAIEFALKRHTGLAKMAVAISLLIAVVGTHYFFNNLDCFITGSVTNIINSWFIGLAILIAGLTRLAGYAFIEEVEI